MMDEFELEITLPREQAEELYHHCIGGHTLFLKSPGDTLVHEYQLITNRASLETPSTGSIQVVSGEKFQMATLRIAGKLAYD